MDPNGENQIVDTDLKEADKVETTSNEKHEEKQQENINEDSKQALKEAEKEESSVQHAQPVEEKPQATPTSSAQSDQESSITNTTEEKQDDEHKDKEIGSEKEKEKDAQHHRLKAWKNPRKKKTKDEQIRDPAQWPTLDEARHSRGQTAKKVQTDPSKSPSKTERDRQNQRSRRGNINWKPLSNDQLKTQGTGEQSSASTTTGEGGERVGTNQGASSGSSSSGSARGYQGGYGRGQPKRRGGNRAPWARSSHTGAVPQEGVTESGAAVTEIEAKDESQLAQNSQDSTTSSSPPQAGQTANPSSESRRYRGSGRGASSRASSGRWRGNNFRPNYFGRGGYAPGPRGGQPFAPLRLPQDPEQFNEQIKKQIEYYFGIDNLCRDIFLRKNMNNEGWISLHMILSFNRVRDLNVDVPRVAEALKDSKVVEVKDESIRRLDDWARWTFPPRVEGSSQTQPQTQESTANETKDQ